ncbi:MAG: NADH-ubiquinone oxidoreductase-F iron-sulfur binding region domain-containing protein [Aeromicrobium sp.]
MTILDTTWAVPTSVIGTARLLAGVDVVGHVDLSRHRSLHGDVSLRTREWLTQAMRDVNLLGRGGAAFPVAIKLDAMPTGGAMNILVNGSEGEPASHKDRTLMTAVPHVVIDGALVAAHALGTTDVTIVVHDVWAHESMVRAARERRDAGHVDIVRTGDGFVGGEIRSVINGLNTGVARPGGRRDLPHTHGVGQHATFASNVETFAQIALLASMGPADYARTGGRDEPGTSLVTLIGDVARPGVVEVPTGIPLELLLGGRTEAPVLIGGYHGTWVRSIDALTLDRAALRASGVPLGAGVIARPQPGTCVLSEVAAVSRWLAGESAGQCGPCFFGLPALAADMQAFADGTGSDAQAARRIHQVRGRGACAHPDGAVQFMSSAITALADDIAVHRIHGSCGRPASTILPLPRRTP